MPLQPSKNDPYGRRTPQQLWYEHMKEYLASQPANRGMTIIMTNDGRTYRFVIPHNP
jgi:hypothetical protein